MAELNEFCGAWLEEGYHHRVNQSTGSTPAARFAKGNALLRFADPEKIAYTFPWQEERGSLLMSEVAQFLIDDRTKRITLHDDPFDLNRITISCRGKHYGYTVVHQLAREVDESVPADETEPRLMAETGLSYLRLLQEKHDARVKSALGRIRFQQIPLPKQEKENG